MLDPEPMDEEERIQLHAWISGKTGQTKGAIRDLLDEGHTYCINLESPAGFWVRPNVS